MGRLFVITFVYCLAAADAKQHGNQSIGPSTDSDSTTSNGDLNKIEEELKNLDPEDLSKLMDSMISGLGDTSVEDLKKYVDKMLEGSDHKDVSEKLEKELEEFLKELDPNSEEDKAKFDKLDQISEYLAELGPPNSGGIIGSPDLNGPVAKGGASFDSDGSLFNGLDDSFGDTQEKTPIVPQANPTRPSANIPTNFSNRLSNFQGKRDPGRKAPSKKSSPPKVKTPNAPTIKPYNPPPTKVASTEPSPPVMIERKPDSVPKIAAIEKDFFPKTQLAPQSPPETDRYIAENPNSGFAETRPNGLASPPTPIEQPRNEDSGFATSSSNTVALAKDFFGTSTAPNREPETMQEDFFENQGPTELAFDESPSSPSREVREVFEKAPKVAMNQETDLSSTMELIEDLKESLVVDTKPVEPIDFVPKPVEFDAPIANIPNTESSGSGSSLSKALGWLDA